MRLESRRGAVEIVGIIRGNSRATVVVGDWPASMLSDSSEDAGSSNNYFSNKLPTIVRWIRCIWHNYNTISQGCRVGKGPSYCRCFASVIIIRLSNDGREGPFLEFVCTCELI